MQTQDLSGRTGRHLDATLVRDPSGAFPTKESLVSFSESFPRRRESRGFRQNSALSALDTAGSRNKCNALAWSSRMTVAMGTSYCQLALSERIEIYRLRCAGWSCRRIAAVLSRAPSTITRELRRNSKRTKTWPGGYEPARADHLAARRRQWDCRFKLARQPALRDLVHDRLAMGWSPEQISGRLAHDEAPMQVSHESIYRYIYHLVAQKTYWNRLLPMRKGRRGQLKRGGLSPLKTLKHRVPVRSASRRPPPGWSLGSRSHAVLPQRPGGPGRP